MEKGVYSGLARWVWVALFVLGTCALLTGGYKYYQSETERIRQEKYRQISAIGKLKAGQIEQWRQERLVTSRGPQRLLSSDKRYGSGSETEQRIAPGEVTGKVGVRSEGAGLR